jgi:hypothetical protein
MTNRTQVSIAATLIALALGGCAGMTREPQRST